MNSNNDESIELPLEVKITIIIFGTVFWGSIAWLFTFGQDFLKNTLDERSVGPLTVIIIAILIIIGISVMSMIDNAREYEKKRRKSNFYDQLIKENCTHESIVQYERVERMIKEVMTQSFIERLKQTFELS